ncbi:MAG TPA: hypothetical protein VGZ91_12305 [Candidatus Sulfotelmatobacter sp.]|jgi:hypothetical protein|nr:hypothetical protein [Candidatus Sulfotelmatobacter sp.]
MKTDVYSWRISADTKFRLEGEARRRGTSVANVLEDITAKWFADNRNGDANDDAEQTAIRKRAMAAIGSVAGGDPTASIRARELVGDAIYQKHLKESNEFSRTRRRAN